MLVFQRVPDMAIDIAIGMAMIPRASWVQKLVQGSRA